MTYDKKYDRWKAFSSGLYLGKFTTELEAARQYDRFVLLKFGKYASTNGLVTLHDTGERTIADVLVKKQRSLPAHIYQSGNFYASITYKGQQYKSRTCATRQEAEAELEDIQNKVECVKQ